VEHHFLRISKRIGAPGFLEKAFVFDGLKIIDSQELQERHPLVKTKP
jgi:hypothetical protein